MKEPGCTGGSLTTQRCEMMGSKETRYYIVVLIATGLIAVGVHACTQSARSQSIECIEPVDKRPLWCEGGGESVAIKTPFGTNIYAKVGGRHSLNGFPTQLVSKVRELQSSCGSKIVSAYRPGARVCSRGRCVRSNHSIKRAVDMQGNPTCMYARLRSWPGGVSTDYNTAPGGKHIHISYNPGGMEWGVRFRHTSKSVSPRTRFAAR